VNGSTPNSFTPELARGDSILGEAILIRVQPLGFPLREFLAGWGFARILLTALAGSLM
jgi:hypothetical protein